MKRLFLSLSCLFLALLTGCAPTPTLAEAEPVTPGCLVRPIQAPLCLIVTPDGDVAVLSQRPTEYGSVTLRGERLEVSSPFCDLPECAPNERMFVRLTYPDENTPYPKRLDIGVTAGVPTEGRAVFTLEGEDFSREALLAP